jgi:hypothetical protein
MKRLALTFLLLAATARADWKDLKEGLDLRTVERLVGAPLIENGSRRGSFVNWTYDVGGYVLFEGGRVKFWQAPRSKK